jgi:diguanylate cyclase (GGDEF)-like protein
MNASSNSAPASPGLENRFAEVDAELGRGEVDAARRLAEVLVRENDVVASPMLEAGAILRLGYCDLAMSRVQRAHDGARQAARAFRDSAARPDELDALALWSRAATVLGRSVEAVEAALLATRLAEELPTGLWTARAHLSLGVAYGWGQAFAQSERAFEVARQLAERHGGFAAQLEVDAERHWVQVLRRAIESKDGEPGRTFDGLEELKRQWGALTPETASNTLTLGAAASLSVSAGLVCALMALGSGRTDEARSFLTRCASMQGGLAPAGWLLAAQSWLQAELAKEAGDLDAAAMHASRMTAWASEVEHLPLASLGHRLTSDMYALQGKADLALVELRHQLDCERARQALHLEGRAEVAGYQVAARRGALEIEDLSAKSMKFEKWAHEDALTGIANLRRFNQCLTEWCAAAVDSGKPLCVALIDVDKFRDINNNFSYETGNEALRGIAQEMSAHVRPKDLPARWGGDEFAILFRDTDMTAALQVAERIQDAVGQHDWASVAPGLRVSVSVGVTEALPGDDKKSLIARSETPMYQQKLAHHRENLEKAIPPAVLRKVSAWLRSAERVVVFVGSGTGEEGNVPLGTGNLAAWSLEDRQSFGHIHGLQTNPREFERFWADWRRTRRDRKPLPEHTALVALSHEFRQATFVTERVDGLLAMAGADNVLELYGNAFRDRCSACGRVQPNSDHGRCLACHCSTPTIRPDMTLLGEEHNYVLHAGAELQFKRADVVLVVDSDATTFPGAGLLEKARARGARVVMIGAGERTRRTAADVSIDVAPEIALKAFAHALQAGAPERTPNEELSDDGFDVLCFLTGQRTDNFGFSFEQAMAWKNWEIERHLGTLPWLFPLPTRSKVNPDAPMPSRQDFQALAASDQVRDKVREAFLLMLRFYGFEWRDGCVERSGGWRNGFATWVVTPSHHDLFISRILGALTLFGLKDEAMAFLRAAEIELKQYRGEGAYGPLWHWRLAVGLKGPRSRAQ